MSLFLQSAGKQFVRSPGLWRDALRVLVDDGRKSLTAIAWWGGFRPFIPTPDTQWVNHPVYRYGGRPPEKYLRYEYTSNFSDSSGSRSLQIEFTFDETFGDLETAYSRRGNISGSVDESYWDHATPGFWDPNSGFGQGGVFPNPDSCPWPYLDRADNQIKLRAPTFTGAFDAVGISGEIPAEVTPTTASCSHSGVGENGPYTISASVTLSVPITLQSAAIRAITLLQQYDITEAAQDFTGNLEFGFDWLNPTPTQQAFKFVMSGEQYDQAIALGQTPTTWIRFARNRFTGGVVNVMGQNGLFQGALPHVSAYGVNGNLAVIPSGGPYNSWDFPKASDAIVATKSLLAAPYGLSCANRVPDTLDPRRNFDYEVIWPYAITGYDTLNGERATPFIGRQDVAPGVLLFHPEPLVEALHQRGYEFGDSYAGGSKPPGSPDGCPTP